MKFFIAIALVAIIVAAVNAASVPDVHLEAKEIAAACRNEFVFPDEEYLKLKSGEAFEASETAKCFTNCFQEKAGILKDDVLQVDVALAKLTASLGEEKAKAIVEACKGESGTGKCETAFKLHQCYKKNNAY